jgi:hypothetical protein
MRLSRGGQPKARDRSKDLRFKYICITGLKIPPLGRTYEEDVYDKRIEYCRKHVLCVKLQTKQKIL